MPGVTNFIAEECATARRSVCEKKIRSCVGRVWIVCECWVWIVSFFKQHQQNHTHTQITRKSYTLSRHCHRALLLLLLLLLGDVVVEELGGEARAAYTHTHAPAKPFQ